MSRWLATNFIQCLRCNGTQRMAIGYKPIPNPILFNSEDQSRNYHNQTRLYSHHHGLDVTQKCESCARLHSQWNVLSHNQYLDMKEKAAKMTAASAPTPAGTEGTTAREE